MFTSLFLNLISSTQSRSLPPISFPTAQAFEQVNILQICEEKNRISVQNFQFLLIVREAI